VCWVPDMNVCITGSWDKRVCVWDGRTSTSTPQHTMNISDRVYCMDVCSPLLAVGGADKKITLYDLRNPSVRCTLRSVSCHLPPLSLTF
jgi:mRNA export factor